LFKKIFIHESISKNKIKIIKLNKYIIVFSAYSLDNK